MGLDVGRMLDLGVCLGFTTTKRLVPKVRFELTRDIIPNGFETAASTIPPLRQALTHFNYPNDGRHGQRSVGHSTFLGSSFVDSPQRARRSRRGRK